MKILKNIKEKEIVGLLFLLLTFIYFFMSKRLKIMYIYYDEMFYYQLSQNILFGNGMKIYNIPQDFQKLVYSFVLMPSFLFKNKILQINIIAFINSILMAFGIIPLYLISKELILKKVNRILCLLIYCFYSDFMFTYTFMSENLFIPLSYWAIYFIFMFYNKKTISSRYRTFIFFSIYFYILYMTKEIGIVFLLTFIFMVFKKIFDQGIKKNKNEIKGLLIVGIIFLGIYIFFKMTIFRGLKYSYGNKVVDIFNIKFGLEYMIYSSIIYISSLLVSLFFVPVLAPLLNYNKLNKKQKSLFFILSSLTVLSIIIVSYTISITENFGNEVPRIHFRYFTYIYIPFIILFYSIIENNCEKIKNYKKSLLWVIIFFTIILFFLKIPFDGSSVDYTVLNFVMGKKITIIKIFSFLLIVSFTCLFYFGKIKLFKILFFIIILFSEIKNIKIQIEKFNDRITTKKNVLNISEIDNYVKGQKNKNFLIVNRGNDRNQKLLDTYLFSKNIYYITEDEYLLVQKNFNGIDLSEKKLETYPNLNKVDYLIFTSKTGKKFLQDNLEIKNIGIYSILKLKKNYKLPELQKDFRTKQSVINLLETSKNTTLDENGILMKPKGYIFGPYITLDKGEYKIELVGKNLKKLDNEFRIMSNGTILANKKINSDELIVNLKLNKETSGIEFILENNSSKEIVVSDIRILKKGE